MKFELHPFLENFMGPILVHEMLNISWTEPSGLDKVRVKKWYPENMAGGRTTRKHVGRKCGCAEWFFTFFASVRVKLGRRCHAYHAHNDGPTHIAVYNEKVNFCSMTTFWQHGMACGCEICIHPTQNTRNEKDLHHTNTGLKCLKHGCKSL